MLPSPGMHIGWQQKLAFDQDSRGWMSDAGLVVPCVLLPGSDAVVHEAVETFLGCEAFRCSTSLTLFADSPVPF